MKPMSGENEIVLADDERFQAAVLLDGISQVLDSRIVGVDLPIDLVVQSRYPNFRN